MLDQHCAYDILIFSPRGYITCYDPDTGCTQCFEFIEPPGYTTAAQQGQRVMQEVRTWDNGDVEEPRNHWGFLFPSLTACNESQ